MSDGYPWRDEQVLRELYVDRGLSIDSVADELDCNHKTVHRWLRRHEIPRRREGNPGKEAHEDLDDGDLLHELYVEEGLSAPEIAERYGVEKPLIYSRLRKFDIETRSPSVAAVKRHLKSGSNAGFTTSTRGYEAVYTYDKGKKTWASIHHLVAIANGADPFAVFSGGDNHVHHKNGIPWDNRPDNLEVLSASEHMKLHKTSSN